MSDILHCILRCIQLSISKADAALPIILNDFQDLVFNFDLENILTNEFPSIDWKFIHESLE